MANSGDNFSGVFVLDFVRDLAGIQNYGSLEDMSKAHILVLRL